MCVWRGETMVEEVEELSAMPSQSSFKDWGRWVIEGVVKEGMWGNQATPLLSPAGYPSARCSRPAPHHSSKVPSLSQFWAWLAPRPTLPSSSLTPIPCPLLFSTHLQRHHPTLCSPKGQVTLRTGLGRGLPWAGRD